MKKLLALYRGEGWYNDAPAYDYYSMWAFQMYGPIWAQMYGHFYPEYAAQFMQNQADLIDNYPYMFNAEVSDRRTHQHEQPPDQTCA